jgi:large subunit ribosomal protein L17
MRHGNKINALGRTRSHRDAMLKNMACSLIEHKRINTTIAKAKVLRGFLEPILTKTKNNSTHSRRVVFSYLQNKIAVDTLFTEIRDKIINRPGGYLRIIKMGVRKHDNTEMAMIEFVDYNTIYNPNESLDGKAKVKTRRSRKKAGVTPSAPAAEVVETVEETPVIEDVVEQTAPEVVEEAPMVAETPAVEESPVVEEEVIAEAPVEDAPATESTEEEEKA